MYEPLALKYRPQTLADLTGQDYIQRTLTAAIAHNRIAPAYLFTGSRGTGKTSTARILAKSLNCHQTTAPTPAPCGSCSSCKAIENGNSMDVTEIDAASHNGVDDARQLIEQSSYTSIAGGRYKVFILDECLAGDSLVKTDQDYTRIGDPGIVGKQVLSYNESAGYWEYKRVTRHMIKGYRETLVVKTADSEIRCTPDHLFRTSKGWIEAQHLTPGTAILVPNNPNNLFAPCPMPKSGHTSSRKDPCVPAVVENSLISHLLSTTALQFSTLSSIGNALQSSKITTGGLHEKKSLKQWSQKGRFAPVDAVKNWTSPTICGLPIQSEKTGSNTPTFDNIELLSIGNASTVNASNQLLQLNLDLSTEPCLGMAQLDIPTKQATILDLHGLTENLSLTGLPTKQNDCQFSNAHPSNLSLVLAMGTFQPLLKAGVIQSLWSVTDSHTLSVAKSKSPLNGCSKSLQKDSHGGTWTMDRLHLCLQARLWSRSTQKATQKQKTVSFNSGLNHWGIQQTFGSLENGVKFTTFSLLQLTAVRNGLNPSSNTLSHQWVTNLAYVESVKKSGQIEPVYDIEVADNHNFVANGLLVHNCHQLSSAAQNALLKSIEEPRDGAVFVLCTTEAHKVLPTVSSRCQVLNFRTISSLAIASRLNFIAQTESIPLKEAGATAIARISQGGLRDAIQLLDQLSLLGEEITPDLVLNISGSVPEAELVNIIRCLSTGNVLGLLTLSRELTELGKEPKTILASLLSLMRDLLVTKHTPNGDFSLLNVGEETARQLTMLADTWSVESIEAGIEKLSSAENRLRYSLQPQVWMEVTLLELLGATQTTPSNNDSTSKLPPPSIDTVWSQVLSKATGSYANLLSNGELIEIDSSKVIVKVKSELLEKFRANSTLIQRLFRKELNNEQLNVEFVAA